MRQARKWLLPLATDVALTQPPTTNTSPASPLAEMDWQWEEALVLQ